MATKPTPPADGAAPPQPLARFVLDESGVPISEGKGDDKFYYIELIYPSSIDSEVTYILNDTYYAPIRTNKRKKQQFQEEITSYGDYLVRLIPDGDRSRQVKATLSQLLKRGYADGQTPPPIQKAISYIEEN